MKSINSQKNSRFAFFQEFLKHPLQIGSIIPSSHFLERRILEVASVDSAKIIVELGSGIGNITRAILRTMQPDAKLLSIEINPRFHTLVSNIEDDRLIAHLGSASELKEIMSLYGLSAPEVVISGIPFSTLPYTEGSQIVEAVSSLLVPKGCFLAYQFSNRIVSLSRPFLGVEQAKLEFLNIPPMNVYKWEKTFS